MKKDTKRVYENVLEMIGSTPIIKLNQVPKDHGIKCQIYAKLEKQNPGGSIKDWVAFNILEEARAQGKIKRGSIVVEGTSGNTGIGLCLTSMVRGYK